MALAWELDEQTDGLFIHFDVKEHHLNLDTFIRTADSARKVVEALDKTFFKSEFGLQIIVLPPAEGTFLTRLALWLGGTGTFLFGIAELSEKAISFVESDVGAAYVEGLTGKAPEDWARDLGKSHRQTLDRLSPPDSHISLPDEVDQPDMPATAETHRIESSYAGCSPVFQLVASMTRGIMEMDADALGNVDMDIGDLPDAMDARAEFYEACLKDAEVKGIGFTPDDDFPIPRSSFPERAQKTVRKKKEEEEPAWVVSTENIYVSSPNWNEEKQNARKWQGIDSIRRERLFVIEDAEFWGRIRQKELQFEGLDAFRVQWAYQVEDGKPKHHRVLRVLEFNGAKLADPLIPDAINAILGSYSGIEASRSGPSLLDFM